MSEAPNTIRNESSALLKIASPLMISYVVDVLGLVILKVAVGKLGYIELGGAGLANDISFQFAIVAMGFFTSVGVMTANARGAKRMDQIGPVLAHGLWLALAIGSALGLLVWFMPQLLRGLGQSEELMPAATTFSHALAWSIPFMVLFSALRDFMAAMMRARSIMMVTLSSILMLYFLMPALVFGAFGFPGLGLGGAGLALGLTSLYRFVVMCVVTRHLLVREKIVLGFANSDPDFSPLRSLIALGLPVSGITALESGMFGSISIMSGWLGTVPLAAYQIMIAWAAIPFVISLSFSEAAMVRVAYWMGAGRRICARQAGNLGLLIGVGLPAVLIVIPIFAPDRIIGMFLQPTDHGYLQVSAMVTSLLVIVALFQIFDGLQVVASHVLRGLEDVYAPLIIAGLGYWVIGLGSAYLLAFTFGFGPQGLWWGVAAGLAFTGLLLTRRFERLTR